jgi:hypothetical protein
MDCEVDYLSQPTGKNIWWNCIFILTMCLWQGAKLSSTFSTLTSPSVHNFIHILLLHIEGSMSFPRIYSFYATHFRVRWLPCHHSMVHP